MKNELKAFEPKKLDVTNVIALRFMDLEKEFKLSIDKYNSGFVLDDSIDYHKEFYTTKNPADGLKVLQLYILGIIFSSSEELIPNL